MSGPAAVFLTLGEAKAFLATNYPNSNAEDPELTVLISAVCNAIEQNLRRPVVARSLQAVSDGGVESILLKPTVFSVTAVEENGTLLTAEQYAVYPDVAYIVRRSGSSRRTWASGVQSVKVTYTAGVALTVAEVPDNLKLVAKVALKFYLMSGPGNFGTQAGEGTFIRPDMFPKQALWLMDPYRVVV